jgi:Amt family ammonium transporter
MSQGRGGVVGGADYFNFNTQSPVAGTHRPIFAGRRPYYQIPHILFMALHMTLFIAAPTPMLLLMIGRIRPVGILLFAMLWGTAIYSPLVHWVWGDGWLESLGVVDSAGGLFHVGVGFSALACAFVLRPGNDPIPSVQATATQENRTHVGIIDFATLAYLVGTAFVNSALTMHADGRAAVSFMNSHLAACAGMVAGPLAHVLIRGQLSKSAACLGAFTGLIAISPGCAMILPQTAIMTGAVAAAVCTVALELFQVEAKDRDSIRVFVLQGVAGVLGCLMVGVFATTNVAGLRWDGRTIAGAIEGNFTQVGLQAVGLSAAGLWGFVGTVILLVTIRFLFRCQIPDQLPA